MEKINGIEAERLIAEQKQRYEDVLFLKEKMIDEIKKSIVEKKVEINRILQEEKESEYIMRKKIREINLRVIHPDDNSMCGLRRRISAIEERVGINKETEVGNE